MDFCYRRNRKIEDTKKADKAFDRVYAVTVKLPRRINSIAPTDDEICDFLVAIAPYRKGTIKQCEKDVSAKYADVVGYINYIASCAAPTVDERWKFEIVRDFLNGENDALSYLDTKDK